MKGIEEILKQNEYIEHIVRQICLQVELPCPKYKSLQLTMLFYFITFYVETGEQLWPSDWEYSKKKGIFLSVYLDKIINGINLDECDQEEGSNEDSILEMIVLNFENKTYKQIEELVSYVTPYKGFSGGHRIFSLNSLDPFIQKKEVK